MRSRSAFSREMQKKKDLDFCSTTDDENERCAGFRTPTNERVRMLRVDRFDRSIVVFRDSRLSKNSHKKKEKVFLLRRRQKSTKHAAHHLKEAYKRVKGETRERAREIHKKTHKCRARRTTGSATKRTTTVSTNRNTRRNCTR